MTRLAVLAAALLAAPVAFAEPAPDFTLRDLDKNTVTLSDFKGQVVLVDFWAYWCEPCKEELPHLAKLEGEFEGKFKLLAISTDDARTASQVKPYVKRNKYGFTVPRDADSSVLVKYNPTKTLPFSVLIDQEGNIAAKHAGFNEGDQDKLREEILALLGEGESQEDAPDATPEATPEVVPAAPAPDAPTE